MKSKYLKDYKWSQWSKYLKSKGSSLAIKSTKISFGINAGSKNYSKYNLGTFLKKTIHHLNSVLGTSFKYKSNHKKASIKIYVKSKLEGFSNNTLGYASTSWWTKGNKITNIKSNIFLKNSIPQFKETLLHEMGHTLGLKHPFEKSNGQPSIGTTWSTKDTQTLMAYGESGNYYKKYRKSDFKALKQIW
jgi:hypothetical protein